MEDNLTNEQRAIQYLIVYNQRLLNAFWLLKQAHDEKAAELANRTADLKKLRHKNDMLLRDMGVWYQAFMGDVDNSKLTLEDYEYIFKKLQRFVTPYVSWWRKRK